MSYGKYILDSIKGKNHKINQDSIYIIKDKAFSLFFLFDGVSNAKNSLKGIEFAKSYIKNNYLKFLTQYEYDFIGLMSNVNKFINQSKIEECHTTYCSIYLPKISEDYLIYSSLGDSRIYRLSNQFFEPLTIDDNLLSNENILNKCLGMRKLQKRDFREYKISTESNRFLMCTDGFYNLFESQRKLFFEILNYSNFGYTKSKISYYIHNKCSDDASYILIETNV